MLGRVNKRFVSFLLASLLTVTGAVLVATIGFLPPAIARQEYATLSSNPSTGWQQTPFYGDAVTSGSSPSASCGSQVFFADAGRGNTITSWSSNPSTGWQQTPFYGEAVTSGTSPSTVLGSYGMPQVFFADAGRGNTITNWSWNPSTGWQQTPFYGEAVTSGTSPSAAPYGSPVFFADAGRGNTITNWSSNP